MALTPIEFPPAREPAASLIMVVYGGFDTARRTLETLAEHTLGHYEVIVVDNASPDGAGPRLRDQVHGATFVMSDRNVGYGAGVNLGALHARGSYLCALNADVAPEPDWLAPLAAVLDSDPTAGAVVPMYLEADGRVQEAGVLVGADGYGYGYGDRWRRDRPELGFRRHIDYGSAAAMLLRATAFAQVGGFDPIYGVGYYEDCDLCFTLRETGWRTVYEPASRVAHIGQSVFSPDLRQRQLDRNRSVFCRRFAEQLRGRPRLARPPFDPHKDLIVRDWWAPERLLLLDGSGRLSPWAAALQDRLPDARVTWLARGGGRWEGPAHPGVERFDRVRHLRRWLEQRRFHYSAVITDEPPPERLAGALARSQPQAVTETAPRQGTAEDLLRRLGIR